MDCHSLSLRGISSALLLSSLTLVTNALPSEFRARAAAAAKANVGAYGYIGCYQEPTNSRALSSLSADDSMTLELCASVAAAASATFFGVEYGRECWYGSSLSQDSTVASSATECSFSCPGDATELCGAGSRLNLYQLGASTATTSTSSAAGATATGTGYFSKRCYKDDASTNGRTLPELYADDGMTVEKCAAYAASKSYTFFGLEYGRECWMGNSLNPLASPSSDDDTSTCDMRCGGAATELCGGSSRMNLYQFGTPSSTSSVAASTSSSSSVAPSTTSSAATTLSASTPTTITEPVSLDLSAAILTSGELYTDRDGVYYIELFPDAPGSAAAEFPSDALPNITPGQQVSLEVVYQAFPVIQMIAKRDEELECTMTIVLGGTVLWSGTLLSNDGDYTTVQVITTYPSGATTLVINQVCDSDSTVALDIDGVTIGPAAAASSSSSVASSSMPLSTSSSIVPESTSLPQSTTASETVSPPELISTDLLSTSVEPSSSVATSTDAPITTAATTSTISIMPSPSSSVANTAATSTAIPVTSSSSPSTSAAATVPTIAAPAYTASTCSYPTTGSPYTAGCTLSGAPVATSGLLAVATGVPPASTSTGDMGPAYEECAGLCAETEDCNSWALDRGNWPTDLSDWTCYLYSGGVSQYAVSYSSTYRQIVWSSRLCYDCKAVVVSSSSSSSSSVVPSFSSATTLQTTTSSGPSSTSVSVSSTGSPMSTTGASTTTAPATTSAASVPTFAAPAISARSCSHPSGQWYTNACTISGYATATTGLLAVATGVTAPASGVYDADPEYISCAAACADVEGCTGYALDRGNWPSDTNDWTCYLYGISIRSYLLSSSSSSKSNPIVWMDEKCWACDAATTLSSSSSSAVPTMSSVALTTSSVSLPSTTTTSAATTTSSSVTCTRDSTPAASLDCDIRGFAQPTGYSSAVQLDTEADCAAYCYNLNLATPGSCASYMWEAASEWCGAWAVGAWTAIGDDTAAGQRYRNNTIEDYGCWSCL